MCTFLWPCLSIQSSGLFEQYQTMRTEFWSHLSISTAHIIDYTTMIFFGVIQEKALDVFDVVSCIEPWLVKDFPQVVFQRESMTMNLGRSEFFLGIWNSLFSHWYLEHLVSSLLLIFIRCMNRFAFCLQSNCILLSLYALDDRIYFDTARLSSPCVFNASWSTCSENSQSLLYICVLRYLSHWFTQPCVSLSKW